MFSLKDKRALITGATGGIGPAIAKAYVKQGCFVVVSGTRTEVLVDLVKELNEINPNHAAYKECQLSNPDSVNTLFDTTEQEFGPIDILVNNAGITKDALLMRMKDEEWEAVININLASVFRLSRSAIKAMMKRRTGRIINISSIVGVTGNPGQTNYCASKAGVIGFSKALAQEIASRNVTVNCIAPGFIETSMTEVLTDNVRKQILSAIPQGKIGHVDDIAAGAVYLASDEASYITGQTLHINGGMTMV